MKQLDFEEANNLNNKIFIDVRSPLEYEAGTIPNAINIPLLDNEERVEIGIIYKEEGTIAAKKRGLEMVAPKLSEYYSTLLSLSKEYENIIVFCARGGLRSTSFLKLLDLMGIKNIYQLEGGVKKYRNYILKILEELKDYNFIVLHGPTGVGKTKILLELEKRRYPILDLEGLAHNKGSVFGHIGEGNRVTQKNFENTVVEHLLKYKDRVIFVESESQRIGNVSLSNRLMDKMVKGKHVLIETNEDNRINILLESYVNQEKSNNQQLAKAANKLRKRLGNEKIDQYIQWINKDQYSLVAKDLLVHYYDPLYQHSIEKYHYDLTINYDKIEEAIEELMNYHRKVEGETKE
ncbi:tRNA 2-selenouridine(34) synthase MnmH [Alkaliphilus serpentinus]|uniref:tRNA 2-selenouridine(34) synthase MnmH n=1 Tax=Alkaliphilus serpentinus TaxID=1482731 RepID=A0A833HLX9_9FIRM|nr:tRNA 2-selenouridine(34) synthase MnmH [Alkaliphilus serpentinus]KAB3526734.1 tRNA 2-selenouridine(34) synthase MnmH [Alkaliphilus serpentinus]